MIAQVSGNIIKKGENSILIEIDAGIVFEIFCPQNSIQRLPPERSKVRIFTYLYVREDQMTLFGFSDESELRLFKSLISVSDIGPKKALSIISKEDFQTIINAIVQSDIRFLSSIPGIGKKTAEKIIIDLKDKLSDIKTASISSVKNIDQEVQKELYSALVNLGYRPAQVEKTIANLKNSGNNDFSTLFREALNIINSI